MKRAIGGFFELEFEKGTEYYPQFYKFNFARHAISFFFQNINVRKIWIPTYICNSVIDSLLKNNFSLKFYHIKNLLDPFYPKIEEDDGLIIVNYFGLLNHNRIPDEYTGKKNVLLDNSQAFFDSPGKAENVVYSARKFFGIPDGAYLKTNQFLHDYNKIGVFKIKELITPLIGRIEDGPEESFIDFKRTQEIIQKTDVEQMSNFSRRVLSSIDYERVKVQRDKNFLFLHERLNSWNKIKYEKVGSPLCYPFLVNNGDKLREFLLFEKIFVAQYWSNIQGYSPVDDYDLTLAKNLICLPIDQRYKEESMQILLNKIEEWKLN